MAAQRQREIVIEFETVRLIRRRTKTKLEYCKGCGGEADFVELKTAAQLFGTAETDLAAFVASNTVHTDDDIDICIPSLLAVMQDVANGVEARTWRDSLHNP